jgi:hypothetical protein
MSDEEVENENFVDGGEYSSKSEFSKAEVVRNQIERCNDKGSKEMRAGYYNRDKLGNNIYVPDSRKEYVRAIMTLQRTLKPEIERFPEVFKKEVYEEKEKELIEKWGVENQSGEKEIPLLNETVEEKREIIGKNNITTGRQKVVPNSGKFNNLYHKYWDNRVILYDEIYEKLHELIDKCDYFKQQISY